MSDRSTTTSKSFSDSLIEFLGNHTIAAPQGRSAARTQAQIHPPGEEFLGHPRSDTATRAGDHRRPAGDALLAH